MLKSVLLVIILLHLGVDSHKIHPCTLNSFSCGCNSIWNSDCYCEDINDSTLDLTDKICSNCVELYKSCWNDNRSLTEYNISDSCAPPDEQVDVWLYTTSLSPRGIVVMNDWKDVLEVFGSYVDFRLHFIVRKNTTGSFISDYGPIEIEVESWMVCATHYYPSFKEYYPFIYCLNQNTLEVLNNLENCSLGHNLDYTLLKDCAEGELGKLLLGSYLGETYGRPPPNPTIYIDYHMYLITQDIEKLLQEKRDYFKALCYSFNNPSSDSYFPWWIFSFMACVAVAILLVIWVAKSDSSLGLSSIFCKVFYEIQDQVEFDTAAREVLRLWQEGALREEEEVVENNNVQQSPSNSSEESDSDTVESDSKEEAYTLDSLL